MQRRFSQEGLEVDGRNSHTHDFPSLIPLPPAIPPPPDGTSAHGYYPPATTSVPPGQGIPARKSLPVAKEQVDIAPPARQGSRRWWRKKWLIIGVVAVILIAAVVGGVVGGIAASKKNNKNKNGQSPSSTMAPQSNSTNATLPDPGLWPKGLEYVVQEDDFNATAVNDTFWNLFEASSFYSVPPIPASLSPSTTCMSDWSVPDDNVGVVLYDHGSPFNEHYVVLQQRGYLYSKDGGKFTVSIPVPDDIVLFWFGRYAVSGYTRANAYSVVVWPANSTNTGKEFDIYVKAGDIVPVRFMWANALGPGYFKFDITDPDANSCFCNGGGKAADCFYTNVSDASPYKFKPYGQE